MNKSKLEAKQGEDLLKQSECFRAEQHIKKIEYNKIKRNIVSNDVLCESSRTCTGEMVKRRLEEFGEMSRK